MSNYEADTPSIDKQFYREIKGWQKTLKQNSASDIPSVKASAEVMKRIFLFADELKVDICENTEKAESKASNHKKDIPVASLLSHGDRMVLTFESANDKECFASWLINEDPEQGVQQAVQESPAVEKRPISTHTISKGHEIKGIHAAAKNLRRSISNLEDRQYGMSIGYGGVGNKDSKGMAIEPDDAKHGYLFINVSKNYNYIMIGAENSAYGKQGEHAEEVHGIKGHTNKKSLTGNSKFSGFSESDREKYNLPDDVGQIRKKFTNAEVEFITRKKAKHFNLKNLGNSSRDTSPIIIIDQLSSILDKDINDDMLANIKRQTGQNLIDSILQHGVEETDAKLQKQKLKIPRDNGKGDNFDRLFIGNHKETSRPNKKYLTPDSEGKHVPLDKSFIKDIINDRKRSCSTALTPENFVRGKNNFVQNAISNISKDSSRQI